MASRTNRIINPLIVVFVLVTTATTLAASIIYVDDDAAGANDGSSWADAFDHLYNALGEAQAGDEIRVAQGIYIGVYFQLINGVAIKGGYAGIGEPDPNARDVEQFETILKGDPDVDDQTNFANYSENSPDVHVIISSHTNWTAVLDGFTITGGYSEGKGGGMYNNGGTPTLIHCKFIRNFATCCGGAIANIDTEVYPDLGGPTLIHCTFIENSAEWGGAIYNNEASPILINCTFIGNSAKSGSGIYGDSSPSLTNCKFIGNSARGHVDQDGIWHDGHGGAIYHVCCGNLKLNNCTFIANSGISGGAMYFEHEPSPKMSECMFIGNLAKNYGGAIYIQDFIHPNLKQCTFADNSAANGNAIACIPSSRLYGRPFILKITNSILWDGGDEIWNNDSSAIAITYSDVEGGWLGEGNIDADPLFVDQGYWDVNATPDDANDDVWLDGDYHLLTGSLCIDTGDPNYIAEPNETDLDGNPRVICGRIDMGAYEFPGLGLLFVDDDAKGKNDGRSWNDAYNYLQDALAYANCAVKTVEIRVAQGVYTPDSNTSEPIGTGNREATFQLIDGVTLKGGYAGFGQPDPNARDIELYETILSGDLLGNDADVYDPEDLFYDPTRSDNSYHLVIGSGTNATAVLDGFTVTGGKADGSNQGYIDPDDYGGGLYNDAGSPTLLNCTFSGNTARIYGGGVHNIHGNPTLTDCVFTGNSATDGGGLNSDYGSPILTGCTFTGNAACSYNADGGFGGGMYNFSSNSTLIDCTFTENSSDEWGGAGGMRNNKSSVIVTNCMFTYNSGGRVGGGGMLNYRGSLILTNCRFIGNSTRRNGGGMDSRETSELTLANCIFIGNSAEEKGGGMCNSWNNPTLNNCTFSGNSADYCGGGIYNGGSSGPKITNCIFWGDAPEEINFDSGTIDVAYNDIQGGWPGEGNIDADPCFVELGNRDANGVWIDGDYHLLPGSPCIDTGDPNYIAEPNETDLDGRPRVINGRIDMGAYEYSPTIPAEVRIIPRTINLASKGNWITCYIWLPQEYDVADIEPDSIFLENKIQPEQFLLNEDKQVAIAKFDRDKVQAIFDVGEIELTILGQLIDGTIFEATDTIKVIDKAGK
jgi:parallel beta-helix repeat protein/predicted outer membrane repeat protein